MIDYISFVKISNALTDLTTATSYYERSIIERSLEDFIRDKLLDWETYSSDIKYSDYKLDYK